MHSNEFRGFVFIHSFINYSFVGSLVMMADGGLCCLYRINKSALFLSKNKLWERKNNFLGLLLIYSFMSNKRNNYAVTMTLYSL